MLAMFPIREMSESHRVEDGVPLVNCLDGNGDTVGRRVFVYVKVRDRSRASPQICIIPYFFYVRGDGLETDDNTNVNVIAPANVIEQRVNGNFGTTPAHSWRVVEDVEHSQTR